MVANHVDSSPEKEEKKTFRSRFFQTGNKQQEAAAAANIPQQQQQGAYLYNPTNFALFPSLLLQETNSNIFLHLHISIPHISLNLHSLYSFDPPSKAAQIIHQHSLILYRISATYRDCCFRSRERKIRNFRAIFKAIDHFFLRKDVSRSGKGETG